ncbi:MAG: triose-phosphate isomerase [bacterium]|nr:triose-phosphate isomerase [bacterium]
MERTPIIAGNWKMNTTPSEGTRLAEELSKLLPDTEGVDVVIAPPHTHLFSVNEVIKGGPIKLAAQNIHFKESGAFTGEISAQMIKDIGCEYVIIGHSERRQFFSETDQSVNDKTGAALNCGLKPIVCVGESLEERESGKALDVILKQLEGGLKDLPKELSMAIIVAYEPVWAIGTGKTATDEQAEEVHRFIRETLEKIFGREVSSATRILYGGSVKLDNIDGLMAQPNIDGALVGGASLKAETFKNIIRFKKG